MTHRDAKFHERLARRGLAGNAGMGTELEQQAPEAWEAELAAHFAAQADSDKLLVSKAAELTMGAHFRGTTLVAVRDGGALKAAGGEALALAHARTHASGRAARRTTRTSLWRFVGTATWVLPAHAC